MFEIQNKDGAKKKIGNWLKSMKFWAKHWWKFLNTTRKKCLNASMHRNFAEPKSLFENYVKSILIHKDQWGRLTRSIKCWSRWVDFRSWHITCQVRRMGRLVLLRTEVSCFMIVKTQTGPPLKAGGLQIKDQKIVDSRPVILDICIYEFF